MRKLTIAAMTFAAGISLAWAQGTTSPSTTTGSSVQTPGAATGNTGSGTAPVGHRQPRRADVPDPVEKAEERTPEDRALDRKIKSICRGC